MPPKKKSKSKKKKKSKSNTSNVPPLTIDDFDDQNELEQISAASTNPLFQLNQFNMTAEHEDNNANWEKLLPLLNLQPKNKESRLPSFFQHSGWHEKRVAGDPPILTLSGFSEDWTSRLVEQGMSTVTPVHLAVHESTTTNVSGYYSLTETQRDGLRARCEEHYARIEKDVSSYYRVLVDSFRDMPIEQQAQYFDCFLRRFEWSARGARMRLEMGYDYGENNLNLEPATHTILIYAALMYNTSSSSSISASSSAPSAPSAPSPSFVVPAAAIRALAVHIMCDGQPTPFTVNCACCDNRVQYPAILYALLTLGGLPYHGEVVVDTLLNIVIEEFREWWCTKDGMLLCLSVCCCLASRQPNRYRSKVLDVLAALLDKNSLNRCQHEEPEGWFLTSVAWYVVFLRGNRLARSVGKAFKMGRLDPMLFGGYTSFLEAMDMKVDFKNDKIAKHALENPGIWTMGKETPEELARKYQDVKDDMLSKATASGVDPRQKSCAQCGAAEAKDKGRNKLLSCSRCKVTKYCSAECQKEHWKKGGHKKLCKTLVAGSQMAKDDIEETEKIMNAWAKSLPKQRAAVAAADGLTNRQFMRKMAFDAFFLNGLEIGDWKGVEKRMMSQVQTICFDNGGRSIAVGDRVKIHPGNSLKWQTVNKICIVCEKLEGDRWGLEEVGQRGRAGAGLSIQEGNLEIL